MLDRLLFALASSSHRELARQVRYLQAENRVLRSKLPRRIRVTPGEQARLARLAVSLGPVAFRLVTIVSARSLRRWIAAWAGGRRRRRSAARRPGRPRTAAALADLVLRMARETGWGSARIEGELRRLGIASPSRATIASILRAAGLRPPPRDGPTWDEFLRMHAETLWQCDFLSKRVWTLRGPVLRHILFFIHVATRRVIVLPSTAAPNPAWCAAQAERFVAEAEASGPARPAIVIHDRDAKFGSAFGTSLQSLGVTPLRLPPRSPNLNAYAERWVRSAQDECLAHFVCIGRRHLDHVVAQYVEHYNRDRPHQGIGNRVPMPDAVSPPQLETHAGRDRSVPRVTRRLRLGLLVSYRRAA